MKLPGNWFVALLAVLVLSGTVTAAPEETPSAVDAVPGRVDSIRKAIAADDWTGALASARALIRDAPEDPRAAGVLGEALYRAGEIEEAGETLAPLAETPAPPVRALVVLGLVRASEGRYAAAAEILDRALSAAPDDPYVLYWAAGSRESRSETVRLLERYLEHAAGEDPDRVEGVRGRIRLLRALGDRPLWVSEERPERLETRLRPIFAPPLVAGYIVDARIGDARKKVPLLLDTGSTGLYLGDRLARKHGFEPISDETTFGGGGSGRHRASRGVFDRFAIGDLKFKDALASIADGGLDPAAPYRGLLDLGIFEGYRVVLDLPEHVLRLEPPAAAPAAEGAPYWTVAGQILVRVRADGGPDGLFVLDTGAVTTLLDLAFARNVAPARIGPATRVRAFGGAREGARQVDGVVLRFLGAATDGGSMNAADLTLRSRLCGVQISGFLGLDLLAHTRLEIDTLHRRVIVVPAAGR